MSIDERFRALVAEQRVYVDTGNAAADGTFCSEERMTRLENAVRGAIRAVPLSSLSEVWSTAGTSDEDVTSDDEGARRGTDPTAPPDQGGGSSGDCEESDTTASESEATPRSDKRQRQNCALADPADDL